jgi:hypothetical protein
LFFQIHLVAAYWSVLRQPCSKEEIRSPSSRQSVTELKKRRYFHLVYGGWSYIDLLCEIINKDDPGQVPVSLDPNSTVCYCRFWIAHNCQCPHLLLLRNRFCRNLWRNDGCRYLICSRLLDPTIKKTAVEAL